MPLVSGLPARTLATGALGLALTGAVAGCSSTSGSSTDSTSAPGGAASSAPGAPASPSPSPIARYVDRVPAGLRASLFTQGSVPPAYADWISTSPRQQNVNGSVEMTVDRRLPPCTRDPVAHYGADRHAAGFAARLFRSDGYIVARQLTVYPGAEEAAAAVEEMVDKNTGCDTYAGKPVVGSDVGHLVDAGELDIPQHDGTMAGETAVAVGGDAGASWWTVVARENNAVVLTRVVDPHAAVRDDGSTDDSIAFRQAVLAQARTSASALDHYAG